MLIGFSAILCVSLRLCVSPSFLRRGRKDTQRAAEKTHPKTHFLCKAVVSGQLLVVLNSAEPLTTDH